MIVLNVGKLRNNVVMSTFWHHSGIILTMAHYYVCNLDHLCQIKSGKERNKTPNDSN